MVPPASSSSMNSAQVLDKEGQKIDSKNQKSSETEKTPGRPEKEETEKSEKTIQNQESLN